MKYRILNNNSLEFFDATANNTGLIAANGTNLKISANNGVIELGDTASDVQVGTLGTAINWTFLGGGTIGTGGINTLSMGQSGDTVNMNVAGVTYQYPSSFLRFNEISGANNKINITTQVPGSVILTLPNRPVVGALTLTDNIISTSNTTGTLTVGGGIGITGNVNVSNTLSVRTESGGNIPFVMQPGIVGISGARFGVAGEILDFYTIGSPFNFATNGPRSATQFVISNTGSAVNYLQVTGAVTGQRPTISAQGSDTHIGILLAAKGTTLPTVFLGSGGSTNQFVISNNGAGTNYLETSSAATGVAPVLAVQGSDTNVGINLLPKGNGSANITSTANSTSNTSGALVVRGGMGITGNLFMSAANNYFATTTGQSYRLGWTDNYFVRDDRFGGTTFNGGYLSINNPFITSSTLSARTVINNDSGNNVVVFAGSSPVRLQNGASSISTTTGSLIVQGGAGISGNVHTGMHYIAGSGNGVVFVDSTVQTTAGSSVANTVYLQGVDNSQNVRIDYSNTALTIAQGVDNSQNVRLDFSNTRMTIIDGVNASQNVRLDYSNTAITIIQGVDVSQNARMVIIEGTDVSQNARMAIIEGTNASQNVRIDYSNTALTIAQGVDNSQNVRLDFSNTAITIIQGVNTTQNTNIAATDGKMQLAYNTANNAVANLGPVITTNTVATVIIANTTASTSNSTGALIVSGGLGVAGNTFLNNSLAAVTTTTSAVNYLQVTGNTTGGSPVLSAQGSDTDVSMNLTSKNVGSINFIVARGGNIPIVTMAAGSSVFGDPATPFIFSPTIPGAWGSKLTLPGGGIATIQTPDSNSLRFGTFGGTGVGGYFGNTQFNITHTGSAVNYLEVTGNTTGGSPVLSGQGSDTNVGINLTPKGSGTVNITSTLLSTSNSTGALRVSGGLGVSGNIFVGGTSNGSTGVYTDILRYSANGQPWSFGGGGGSIAITNDTTNSTTLFPLLSTANSGTLSTANTSNTKLYYVPSTGTLNATVFNSLSDAEYKENIITITDALNTVNQIDGVSFSWKDNGLKSYGVVAQELEKILPELVNTVDNVKSVNYSGIIAFLINSVKELDARVKQLESK